MDSNDEVATGLSLQSDLVNCISMLEHFGVIDFNGHASTRLDDGHILINTGSSVRSAMTVEQLVVVSMDGAVAAGSPKPPAELPLHLAIYQARPDVKAVVHGHPKWSTLLTAAHRNYRPIMAQGALLGDVPVFTSPASVNNDRIGAAVADTLSDRRAVLLPAHGSVVVGGDLLEAAVLAIYLELNAERQIGAAMIGDPYYFSDDEIQACQRALEKRMLFEKCWNYYAAKYAILN